MSQVISQSAVFRLRLGLKFRLGLGLALGSRFGVRVAGVFFSG